MLPGMGLTELKMPMCARVATVSTVPMVNYGVGLDPTIKIRTPASAPRGSSNPGRLSANFRFLIVLH